MMALNVLQGLKIVACDVKRGTMIFHGKMKLLVFFLIIAADLCHGKAFREEGERDRGKRLYSHVPSAGLHQTYDPQSNAEHWMKGKFYEPQVDGQPIYVPALDQPGSYQEFLDAYYKSYTPAWNPATPVPQIYSAKGIYEKAMVKDTSDKKDDYKYAPPIPKEDEFSVEINMSDDYDATELEEDYNAPEILDKTILTELEAESDLMTSESSDLEEFEEPVIHESLKKTELSKIKPQNDRYAQPSIIKTVKQKQKTNTAKKDVSEKPSMPKTKPQLKETDVYEMPIIYESLKKTDLPKSKPQYDQPSIIKTKQKPKTNTAKKDTPEKLSKPKPQLENTDDYEKPVVHKTVKGKPSKPITNTSTPKYGEQTSQIRKKSKGKRRKQYSKLNKPASEIANAKVFDPKTVETPDELSKKDGELYSSQASVIKEKVIVKTEQKDKVIKTKEKAVVKTDAQYKPVKSNLEKPETKDKPMKPKEKVIVQNDPKYEPVKIKEKVVIKSDLKDKPIKEKNIKYGTKEVEPEVPLTRILNDQNEDLSEIDKISNSNAGNPIESEPDLADTLDMTESELLEIKLNSELATEKEQKSEISKSGAAVKPDSIFPNNNDFRNLASINSNIWSLLFNPNAEQNRLKQKRCITRNNETGFCTYIQNCEVPNIATSLEQLLNNACVIDDIFIGVCCPEFPVETVKVHWDQTPSDFDNQIEDEFGHNTEDCGIRSNEASELQSWPWKAPLVSMSNGKIFCGGVVVSEDHILTAAHCTTKIPKNQILVRLGQYDDASGDDYAVVEIKRHAQYNPRTMHNDVALLKLGRKIMKDAHIGKICLPEEEDKNDHDGETATLLGWRGIFGTKSQNPEFLEVVSNKECEKRLGMKVPSTSLCTETRKESERTCNADSGAPLVIEDDGKYEVIGILSWNRNDCDQRFPSTFSRVTSYTGWIKKHIE